MRWTISPRFPCKLLLLIILDILCLVLLQSPGYLAATPEPNNQWWVWGAQYNDQLDNNTNNSNIPVQINDLNDVVSIAVGDTHILALKSDGTVWAWGTNDRGELGNGNNINSNVPVQVSGLSDVVAIAASGD